MTAGDTPTGTPGPGVERSRPSPERRSGERRPGEPRLEAPHRRGGSSPRVIERLALVGYRGVERLLTVLPQRPAATVFGLGAQLSYLVWPSKRRWSNRNFGHVLGVPPDDPRVRRLALRAYRAYGRYLVELMRLPALPSEDVARLVPGLDVDGVLDIWHKTEGRGLILVVAHMGSNEAIGASLAGRGIPISVVADDSSFPELFDHLRRQREAWGFHLIPWRNLREIFGVLRRGEMLGLLVDWGYRADGIPVRFFDAWTALPAGPATLAAKTGARLLPITIRRQPGGTYHASWPAPIEVMSSDPAELQRATQAIADALAANIGAAPDQWYSFKPIWPADPAESTDLERRARLMQAGTPDPGPEAGQSAVAVGTATATAP